MLTAFCLAIVRETDHLQDPRLEGRIIFKLIFRIWNGDKYWIEVVQGRSRQRNILIAVMKSKGCINWIIFLDKVRKY